MNKTFLFGVLTFIVLLVLSSLIIDSSTKSEPAPPYVTTELNNTHVREVDVVRPPSPQPLPKIEPIIEKKRVESPPPRVVKKTVVKKKVIPLLNKYKKKKHSKPKKPRKIVVAPKPKPKPEPKTYYVYEFDFGWLSYKEHPNWAKDALGYHY